MKVPATIVVVLVLTFGVLLMPLPGHWSGPWQGKILDLGHVPLFGVLTLMLWTWLGPRLWRPVAVAVALAGLTEILQQISQPWLGRRGEFQDFLYGALGSLAAGAAIGAWQNRSHPVRVSGFVLVMAGALAWPMVDTVPYGVDAYEGIRAFPILADFSTERQMLRWRWRQSDMSRIATPNAADGWAGRIDFHPGPYPYPYGALRPILRDLRAYGWLCCSFAVEGGPLEVVISLRSGSGQEGETTHYQVQRTYPTGDNLARLNLAAIAPKAEPLPLDLSDVWIIQFFMVRPEKTHSIQVYRVWLED